MIKNSLKSNRMIIAVDFAIMNKRWQRSIRDRGKGYTKRRIHSRLNN